MTSEQQMADLYQRGRSTFGGLVEGGEDRLDRIFQAVPALGELAVGTVYGHLHERRAQARTSAGEIVELTVLKA
jgi:4-carboxymuconolactone decarboxylase